MKRTWFAETFVAAAATFATIAAPASARTDVESPTYIYAPASLATPEEKTRWYKMISALEKEFNEFCGDSFCEGEYSEIAPIFFECSVARASGELRSCVWVFGEVERGGLDEATGKIILAKSKIAACNIPVTGTAAAFLDAIHGLDSRLPGTSTSISEVLYGCL